MKNVSIQLRLDQPIGLSPVYCTCSLLILLVLHTYLTYIRLSIIYYYSHRIYRLFSLSLFHFIFLTWYQSQCSDFLAPVVFFGIFLLPLPLSSTHCQKRVTAVRSTTPKTLGSSPSIHHPANLRAQIDRSHNSRKNPTQINSIQHHTCSNHGFETQTIY